MQDKKYQVLKSVFGYDEFRGQQAKIIDHILSGKNAMVLMPTGAGKSLCYQIPGLCLEGLTIVVSPLIALMENQVVALQQLGVKAAFLNSSRNFEENFSVIKQMRSNELDLVYVAPERMLSESFLSLLDECNVSLFAIDEAHCVSQWGHDFRPEYQQLEVLRQQFPNVPRVALTATADKLTRKDILKCIGIEEDNVFVSSFDRPNIKYHIKLKNNAKIQLINFLNTHHPDDSGIVYCISRKRVMQMTEYLIQNGFKALPYHAGLDNDIRSKNQERFIKEDNIIIVATVAFGMGIDKPDVRFVAHMDLPKSIESYYQETGRAGRDGLSANAWLVYGLQDISLQKKFLDDSDAPPKQKELERQKLESLLGFVEATQCRREFLLKYFGETQEENNCGKCDNCLMPVKSFDATVAVQKALSCVFRTGQKFGTGHVIDVLLGKSTAKVQSNRHDKLSTYGIGKEFGLNEWKSILRQAVSIGLLNVDLDDNSSLKLAARAKTVLKGEEKIFLRQDKNPAGKAKESVAGPRKKVEFDSILDQELFDKLKQHRLSIARAQGVPPYVIFHDSVLAQMVLNKPKHIYELRKIPGIGEVKLDRYGESFLDVVNNSTGKIILKR